MADPASAKLQVELYYQASVPAANTKPVHWDVTVTEGGNLYLEDKEHDHPTLPHYNFRVAHIARDGIRLEQIPDCRGHVEWFYTGLAEHPKQFRVEPGKPQRITLNVPGGRPVWTVTWAGR